MRPTAPAALLGTLLLLLAPLAARSADCAPDARASLRSALMTPGFLQAHPDLHWRGLGMQAWRQGRPDHALVRFKRAAAHADKLSQSLVARMYQEGTGTAPDPVLAYIWMDLAAERGTATCCWSASATGTAWMPRNGNGCSPKGRRCMRPTAMPRPSRAWRLPCAWTAAA
jgi:TPR repeat protein